MARRASSKRRNSSNRSRADAVKRGVVGAFKTLVKAGSQIAGRTRRGSTLSESRVVIEYSPHRDGDPDPGEVVWTWVPFQEDPSQGKDRPVVVIGRRGDDLVGIPLTTKRHDREAQLNLGTGAWDPKRRTSYARIWRMLDFDPDSARREGAALDRKRFNRLIETVDEYYDIVRPST